MKNRIVTVILSAALIVTYGCGRQSKIRVNGVRAMEHPAGTQSVYIKEPETDRPDAAVSDSGTDPGKEQLAVYVRGAVVSPGVYYLPSGSRVCDAIDAAGGFSQEADTQYLNLARPVNDSEMVSVYTLEETALMKEQGTGEEAGPGLSDLSGEDGCGSGSGRVDLNSASKEQLMTLPGIGESKAEAIIRYREESGPFSCTEDVMNISGIKDRVYSQIRDRITVQ